jgi:hypothetical protein
MTYSLYLAMLEEFLNGDYATFYSRLKDHISQTSSQTSSRTSSKGNSLCGDLHWVRWFLVQRDFSGASTLLNQIQKRIDQQLARNSENQFKEREIKRLRGDYHFLLGRCAHFLYQPSRPDFLRAAQLYKAANEGTSFASALVNSILDLMDSGRWDQVDLMIEDIQAQFDSMDFDKSHRARAQLQLMRGRSFLARNQCHKFLDLYFNYSSTFAFQNLAAPERNIFHFYAMDTLTILDRAQLAQQLVERIEGTSLSEQTTLKYFAWLWEWRKQGQPSPIDFQIEDILESLREKALYFLELSNHAQASAPYEDPQVRKWKEDDVEMCPLALTLTTAQKQEEPQHEFHAVMNCPHSAAARLIQLLARKPMDKFEIAQNLFGKIDNVDEKERTLQRLYETVREINSKCRGMVVSEGNLYRIMSRNTVKSVFQKGGYADLIVKALERGPQTIEQITKVVFYHQLSSNAPGYADMKRSIQRTLRRMRSQYAGLIHHSQGKYELNSENMTLEGSTNNRGKL